MEQTRLRIAIQKSGRLADGSNELLKAAGLKLDAGGKNQLLQRARNMPIDLLLVRDDDIPNFVYEGIADIGISGENVHDEHSLMHPDKKPTVAKRLGFSRCKICLATPKDGPLQSAKSLQGKTVATSYPLILQRFFDEEGIEANIVEMSGSVEVAPKVGIADAIFDIVSSGATLTANGLGPIADVFFSEALLLQTPKELSDEKQEVLDRLLTRIEAVQNSRAIKYVMLNAPVANLAAISDLLPGAEAPTIIPLQGKDDMVACHSVVQEDMLWETIEALKAQGAKSILVTPIEKMMA